MDARWEHCLLVVDAGGNIVEQWTQWDKIFKRPHFVAINPYDPEQAVYDQDGRFLYAWGVWGDFPGGNVGLVGTPVYAAWK